MGGDSDPTAPPPTATDLPLRRGVRGVQPVERAEYEGVDYAWVMQTTFVVTILVGAPVAALLSTAVALDSWGARAAFAVRVGAPIWFVTAVAVALYARRTDAGDGGRGERDDGEEGDGESAEGRDGETAEEESADAETGEADAEESGETADSEPSQTAEPDPDDAERAG